MKRSGFILVLVLLTVLSCSKKNEMIEPVLKELDETIDNRQRFENEKQDRIARLKKDLQETNDIHKRTELYSSLFDQYKNYQYDSAFVYAKLLEKNALKEGSKIEYRAKSQVALLHCFKSVGFFNEAVDVIRAFDPKDVPSPICAEFYFLGAETWQNLSSFVSGTEALASKYDAEKLECYDKVLEYAAPDSYLYGYANLDKMLIENYSDSLAISAREKFKNTTRLFIIVLCRLSWISGPARTKPHRQRCWPGICTPGVILTGHTNTSSRPNTMPSSTIQD